MKISTEDACTQELTEDRTGKDQQGRRKYEKRNWIKDPTGIATRTRMKTGRTEEKNDNPKSCLAYALMAETCPVNFNEALISSDAKKWKEAMSEELKSLTKNKAWELVELPPDRRAIKNK